MMSQTGTHRVKERSKYITNIDGRFKQQLLNTHPQETDQHLRAAFCIK